MLYASRSKWREDDEFGDGDSGRRKAGNESGDAPYLPDLEPFIGEYRRANKNEVEGEQEGVNFNGRNASAGSWRDGQRPNQPDEGDIEFRMIMSSRVQFRKCLPFCIVLCKFHSSMDDFPRCRSWPSGRDVIFERGHAPYFSRRYREGLQICRQVQRT